MQDNKALDIFQEKLIDLLLKELPPDEIVMQLKSDKSLVSFHPYIDTFDVTMVGVASEIAKKWETDSSNYHCFEKYPFKGYCFDFLLNKHKTIKK